LYSAAYAGRLGGRTDRSKHRITAAAASSIGVAAALARDGDARNDNDVDVVVAARDDNDAGADVEAEAEVAVAAEADDDVNVGAFAWLERPDDSNASVPPSETSSLLAVPMLPCIGSVENARGSGDRTGTRGSSSHLTFTRTYAAKKAAWIAGAFAQSSYSVERGAWAKDVEAAKAWQTTAVSFEARPMR
jgi:hypothetical protein